jgi:archaellum component FlaF (FlaF/FlaG flagellin family)
MKKILILLAVVTVLYNVSSNKAYGEPSYQGTNRIQIDSSNAVFNDTMNYVEYKRYVMPQQSFTMTPARWKGLILFLKLTVFVSAYFLTDDNQKIK